jgi:hypothetical protein
LPCSSIASAIFINSALTDLQHAAHCHCVPPVVLLDIHITLDQVSVSACGLYVDISWNDLERGAAALPRKLALRGGEVW